MKASLLFLLVGCLLIMVGCAGVKTSEVATRPPTQYRFCQQQHEEKWGRS
jgi:uncharacterized protein YceK